MTLPGIDLTVTKFSVRAAHSRKLSAFSPGRFKPYLWSQVFFLTEKSRDPGSRFLPSRFARNKNIATPVTKVQNVPQGTLLLLL